MFTLSACSSHQPSNESTSENLVATHGWSDGIHTNKKKFTGENTDYSTPASFGYGWDVVLNDELDEEWVLMALTTKGEYEKYLERAELFEAQGEVGWGIVESPSEGFRIIYSEEVVARHYKANCLSGIGSKDLVRYEDEYIGKTVSFVCQVLEIYDDGVLHVVTDEDNDYFCIDGYLYVGDLRKPVKTKILVGDILTIYGEFSGVSQRGTACVKAHYIDFLGDNTWEVLESLESKVFEDMETVEPDDQLGEPSLGQQQELAANSPTIDPIYVWEGRDVFSTFFAEYFSGDEVIGWEHLGVNGDFFILPGRSEPAWVDVYRVYSNDGSSDCYYIIPYGEIQLTEVYISTTGIDTSLVWSIPLSSYYEWMN